MLSIHQESNTVDSSNILQEYLRNCYGGFTEGKQNLLKQKIITDNRISKRHQQKIISSEFSIMYPEHDADC